MADEVDVPNQFASGARALASEVNENFSAVEMAIDDNAQRVVALEAALGGVGVPVSVDGVVVGRYLDHIVPSIAVDVAGVGMVRVRLAGGLRAASEILVLSPTGYRFLLRTSDSASEPISEGELNSELLYYDGADCSGDVYYPVEGDTGFFSDPTFTLGSGRLPPIKRSAARQGWVFQSPDPTDATPIYMMRRNAVAQVVSLASRRLYAPNLAQAVCQNLSQIADFDDTNPLHVDHWVVPLEALDAAEAGISSVLGGEILVGL